MKPQVTIIDYGMGNLLSVVRAFEHCGADVRIADTPDGIRQADYLVLPGVGAFADGMKGLHEQGLIEPIKSFARMGGPFLGICLGMQMMLDISEEFGRHEGLGLIPGKVTAIPPVGADGSPHRIPHIGWNNIVPANGITGWRDSILSGIREKASVYFVHSYAAVPSESHYRLADSVYNGLTISAAIRSGSLYGCQFHPEKSGAVGLAIISQFLGINA